MPTFSTNSARAIIVVIVGLFAAMVGRVGYLQTYGRETTIARADRQQHLIISLPARRGDIYDRNGLIMAGSVQTHNLFVDPKFMQDCFQEDGHSLVEMDEALDKLAGIIGQDSFDLAKLLGDRATSRFIKVAENLDDSTVQQVRALNLPGVGIESNSARCYPMGSLAAHVLGGCGTDGNGLDGLELKYNSLLSGRAGFARETKDAQRRPIGVDAQDYLAPEHGQHLVLTIDSNLQMIAEQELRDEVEYVHGSHGEFVAMDPYTGEILALANYPTFNPQTLSDSTKELRRDSAVVVPYEPGSAFKPFFVGPALMWNLTTPSEVWSVPALTWFTPYGRAITDVEHYGNLCTWDGLVYSSNIVMSQLGERMGNARLRKAITSFGFGKRTGIDLPGEDSGVVYSLKKWTRKSTESIAQGYEVLVTPLQLARAFTAYANGGKIVTPRLLLGTVDQDGKVLSRQPRVDFDSLPQVIDPATAAEMRRILCDVVIRGTAAGTRSKIWNIAGKTGTAYIAEAHGYSHTRYNSTFMCCAPFENPRLVVVCVIHDPDRTIAHYGGKVAAPVAVKFLQRALTYMEVPASPDLPLPSPEVAGVIHAYSPDDYSDRSFGALKETDENASEASANQ